MQCGQIQPGHPGVLEHLRRKIEAELLVGKLPRPPDKILVVLIRRDTLEHIDDAGKTRAHGPFVIEQQAIEIAINQRMLTHLLAADHARRTIRHSRCHGSRRGNRAGFSSQGLTAFNRAAKGEIKHLYIFVVSSAGIQPET